MLRKKYYCFVAGLPDLFFDEQSLKINSSVLREYLCNELNPNDLELVKHLFLPHDNSNLLNLVFNINESFDTDGNFQENYLKEQIENPTSLPVYLVDFLRWIRTTNHQKEYTNQAENKLNTLFYRFSMKLKNDFLRDWFFFDLNLKNVITTVNCIQYELDISQQLVQIEENREINSFLLSKHLKPEYFEEEIPFVHQILKIALTDNSIIEKEKSMDLIRWQYLDENTFFHFFTIEKILSFTIKLMIIERWIKLDKETGQQLLHQLISELKESYQFPPEYIKTKKTEKLIV